MKNYIWCLLFLVLVNGNLHCMEQKQGTWTIQPYTLDEIKNYKAYNDLYYNIKFVDLTQNSSNQFSSTIKEHVVPYQRLAISTQQTKDAFLMCLQNRLECKSKDYPLTEKDQSIWTLIRTWIAICAMIDAKEEPASMRVFGDNGAAHYLAEKAQDQQLLDLLKAHAVKKD